MLRKYAMIYRVSLAERMTYRADFLITTLFRFLPTLTTILLWNAIYAGAGSQTLAGFSYEQTICYLLIVNISRMFSSMPGLAGGIAREVRDGTLKKYLIQPLDLIGYLLSYRMAHKTAYIIGTALPYALLFGVCYRFFIGNVPTEPGIWAAYVASLLMAFLIGFFFEASVGMVGFWFLEITSILWVVMTLNFFISGQMLPLDFLPPFWAGLLKLLPFQYMAYFPAVIFLRKVQGAELLWGLALELFWVVFFVALCRWLYRSGLKRYGAYGG
ncbi:ABC transporter permease [Tautonia sociabilis]|uniref:ABC transporter permease n=2 Tax=Tautonia sociabilis TaxID=2080755 RepID=A0A432MKC8_9BACT|nr:ABC transporter permease [Tautonia sociabilis]